MNKQLDQNLHKGFKGGISIYVATLINMITAFATSIILVRGLSQEDYGSLKLIGSIQLAGTYICSLGLEKTFIRFGTEFITKKNLSALKRILFHFCSIRGISLVVFGVGLLIFKNLLARFFNLPRLIISLFPIILVILFFSSMNNLYGKTMNAARLAHVNNSIIRSAMQIFNVIGFVCVLKLGLNLWGILIILLCNHVISALYFGLINIRWFRKIQKTWPKQLNPQLLLDTHSLRRRIFRFASFSFLGTNVNIFRDILIDNFFIARYLDITQVALYGLASSVVNYATQFNPSSMLKGIFQPIFIGRYVETNNVKELLIGHYILTKITLFSTLPLYLILVFFGSQIIKLVYSPQYLAAIPTLFFLCFFFFFIGLISAYSPLIYAFEKSELFLISGIFSVYNLIMDIILIPSLGIKGAAIATGSAGLLQYFFYWSAFRWYLKLKILFPWEAFGKIFINSIPMMAFCLLARTYIQNIFLLIASLVIAAFLYLLATYVNNVFDEREINLFKRAIGKKKIKTQIMDSDDQKNIF